MTNTRVPLPFFYVSDSQTLLLSALRNYME